MQVMLEHVTQRAPRLTTLRPDCPSSVSNAVERMLAKGPEERWPSIADAVEAMHDLVADVSPENMALTGSGSLSQWLRATRPGDERPPKQRKRTTPPDDPRKPAPEAQEESTMVTSGRWTPETGVEVPSDVEQGESTQLFILRGSPEEETPPLSIALTITSAKDPRDVGRHVRCEQFPFTVGRGTNADLVISGDQTLSRTHVQIVRDADGFAIRDMSRNGIFVNGRRVGPDAEPLLFGATIVLSESTRLAFAADVPELPDLTGNELGQYRLGKAIHQSIKATTYLAEDTRFARALAVKVFSPVLMQIGHYRDEFRRQAELAARLLHPHICKILDYGDTTLTLQGVTLETSYLCMEYMEGGNLSSQLEKNRAPPLDTAVSWIRAIAGALDHAHRNGVYHGDLKPDCIVFDRDGVPYLTDFALASSDDGSSRGALFGTPAYLAPERWDGTPPSPAADQYSLAALAYLMVTGSRPHEGQSDPDVRRRNFARGALPAHEEATHAGRDDVSPALSAVLAQGLHTDPAERYPSVTAFESAFVDAVTSPRTGLQPCVFLSYQREASAGWANLFASTLEGKHDWSIFLDTMARDGAPRIPERIRNAIERADVFVCFLAPGTLDSNWVRQEIEIAHESGKPMVPVFHEAFRREHEKRIDEPGVKALLDFDAVHLFDRRNIHVSHSIDDLGDRIQRFVENL
jgi:serine/threonine-protein kinase